MNDIDVKTNLTRDEVEELWKDLLADVRPCIERALAAAGVSREKVSAVELIGGSSWIPVISRTVSEAFNGMNASRTLNASEAVAKGACLQVGSHSILFWLK
jgi:molecular chaperone DnaK (HSP70)